MFCRDFVVAICYIDKHCFLFCNSLEHVFSFHCVKSFEPWRQFLQELLPQDIQDR